MTLGFVAENDSHVERAIIPSNKCFVFIPQHKLVLFVHLVSNVDDSLLNENDFVDVIKLFENNCVGAKMSVFHLFHQLNHEISVSLIFPVVSKPSWIHYRKSLSKNAQEVAVIKFTVYSGLN